MLSSLFDATTFAMDDVSRLSGQKREIRLQRATEPALLALEMEFTGAHEPSTQANTTSKDAPQVLQTLRLNLDTATTTTSSSNTPCILLAPAPRRLVVVVRTNHIPPQQQQPAILCAQASSTSSLHILPGARQSLSRDNHFLDNRICCASLSSLALSSRRARRGFNASILQRGGSAFHD